MRYVIDIRQSSEDNAIEYEEELHKALMKTTIAWMNENGYDNDYVRTSWADNWPGEAETPVIDFS